MKRILVGLVLGLSALVANAGISSENLSSAGFNKLSEAQKIEILKQVNEKVEAASAPASVAISSPEKIDKWIDVGTRIGQMMGGAAKEVGIAVNEFVKTPVGKWTMALIIWNYMGTMIVHVFGGVVVLVFGTLALRYFMARLNPVEYTYDHERTNWLGRSRVIKVERNRMDGETIAWFIACQFIVIGAALIVMFTF